MKLKAAAKINLGLSIKKRLASGYHQVELVNCQVNLFDEIILKKTGKTRLPFGQENTIVKALALLKQNPAVSLIKNIPVGCGLGGGSSDAAQVLKFFKRIDLAPKIGLDVAYACLGGVRWEEQGDLSGSKFKVLPDLPKCFFVVCVPQKQIKTAWTYREIDKLSLKPSKLEPLIRAIKRKDLDQIGQNLVNDFEPLVTKICSEIKTIQTTLLGNGALGVSISGKGPAVFGIFNDILKAKKAQKLLVKKYRQTYLCSPVTKPEK